MIKLIATDMDGTFLRSDHTMPPEFPELLHTLTQNNIIFSVASGRPYLTLRKNFEAFHEDMLFISDNGAHVVYKGEEIAVHLLDNCLVHQLIMQTRQIKNAYSVVCTTNGAFVESSERAFLDELEKYYVKYTVVDDLTQINERIIKFTVCDLDGAEHNSFPVFKPFMEKLQICVAGYVWVDMMPNNVNKGMAICDIQKHLNITFDETMVFGDYLNDVEMMQNAYYSYAMANAHPDLIKVARFQAASNDENGVVLKIKEMLENNLLPLDK